MNLVVLLQEYLGEIRHKESRVLIFYLVVEAQNLMVQHWKKRDVINYVNLTYKAI